MTTRMKQRYERTYEKGRPTNGWQRGERISASAQVKPGDVLIAVSNQFRAENLVRVLPRDHEFPAGFEYEYADCRNLTRSDGQAMFCHDFELAMDRHVYFRAIDRRPKDRGRQRIAAHKLPAWLSYPNRNRSLVQP